MASWQRGTKPLLHICVGGWQRRKEPNKAQYFAGAAWPCRVEDHEGHDRGEADHVCVRARRSRSSRLFLRRWPEVVALYETIARLSSLALQHGAPIEGVGGMLLGLKFDPRGPVTGHDRIKFCSSPTDYWGGIC